MAETMTMAGPALETVGLTKQFGPKVAVHEVSLHVPRGSFYGFLGPNGAGKSTTIRMLTGLLAPTRGQARILGLDLAEHPLQVKQRVGVLPEDLCIFESLTAREYLSFIGRMYGLAPETCDQRTEELLSLLGLADTGRTLAMEFSHGMKKKLALAAALIHDPELLFLDEPFEGIDAVANRTIRHVLDRLIARGRTIFLTSHILEIVERLCTHVGIISEGKLVHEAPLEKLGQGHLERLFLETVGQSTDAEPELSWLGGGV